MTVSSGRWALALHGGAGVEPGRDYERAEATLARLIRLGEDRLKRGDAAQAVVVDLVAELEASGRYVAGRGSARNSLGEVELDASVMDGATGQCGAVAAMQGIRSAVRAAQAVMAASPHVLLVGDGAARFARDQGLDAIDDLDGWLVEPDGYDPTDNAQSHGTVGAVALDQGGRLAAATSTGGLYNALPGRVGDSAIIGAGVWADKAVAISCTGEGEAFIRTCAAHAVARAIACGETPDDAMAAILNAVAAAGGDGGLILVTAQGQIAMAFNSPGMKRASVSSTQPAQVGALGADLKPVPASDQRSVQ